MRRLLAICACAACGGAGGDDGRGPTREVIIFCAPAETEPPASALVQITITVDDANGEPVADAQVAIDGQGIPGDVVVAGTYRQQRVGCAPAYAVEIATPERTTAGTITMPAVHVATVSPDPPVLGAAATASWSPSGEPDLRVLVNVQDSSTTFSYSSSLEPDDGSAPIPGSAFPRVQGYTIFVQRERVFDLDDLTLAHGLVARPMSRGVL